jgi:hypothetical protein
MSCSTSKSFLVRSCAASRQMINGNENNDAAIGTTGTIHFKNEICDDTDRTDGELGGGCLDDVLIVFVPEITHGLS